MADVKVKRRKEGDPWIVLATLALSLFGLVMVFSASYYSALSKTGSPYTYLRSDFMFIVLGWILFIFCANVDFHFWKALAWPALGVGIVLLLLIFTPLAITLNNATRWLDFKIITVMPGEVIKSSLIFFLAYYYGDDPYKVRSLKSNLPVLAITAVCFLLIYKQPNLSTAGTVVILVLAMMFIAGLQLYWIVGAAALGVGAFVVIVLSPAGRYMLTRVQTFFDPFKDMLGSGYQVVQALLALGSGGVLGKGLGKGVQKMLYLPEAESDFIFAIIGEELGYVGCLALMFAYLFLIWRCFKVCIKAPDRFGMLLASGISLHLAIQVILNIAVVSASFFPTGIVLPFISLGGNAMLLFLAEMGILFNISKHSIDIQQLAAAEA
jgi:cell division protein FtsW